LTNRIPIAVELHGSLDPQHGVYGGAHDVSEFVTACSWSCSVRSPWESINVSLTIPLALVDKVLPGEVVKLGQGGNAKAQWRGATRIPHSAYWLIIRDTEVIPEGSPPVALAWGKVDSVTIVRGVDQSSGGHYCEVTISATSWAALLEETKPLITYATTGGTIASSYLSPDSFIIAFLHHLDVLMTLDTGFNLGRALQAFWKVGLARGDHWLNLPDSMFMAPAQTARVPFSDIPIVYAGSDTVAGVSCGADMLAPSFAVANTVLHVPGGIPKNIGGFGSPMSSTWWGMLTGMFSADPNVVELFPVLDVPDYEDPAGTKAPASAAAGQGVIISQKATPEKTFAADMSYPRSLKEAWTNAKGGISGQSANYQRIVTALGGSRPAVIYRMKPFVMPFDADTQARWFMSAPLQGGKAPTRAEARAKLTTCNASLVNQRLVSQSKTPPFEAVDGGGLPALHKTPNSYQIFAHDIFDYTETVDDAHIVNGVVVYPPNMTGVQGTLAWDSGLVAPPIFHWDSPREYGARMFELSWPFLGDQKEVSTLYYAGLAEMVYAIVATPGKEPVIQSGSASVTYRPRARAGHWFNLSQRESFANTRIFRQPSGDSWTSDRLGYASSVTHSVSLGQNGEYQTGTEIQFERILRNQSAGKTQTFTTLGACPARLTTTAQAAYLAPFKYS